MTIWLIFRFLVYFLRFGMLQQKNLATLNRFAKQHMSMSK
jgi:hypothetical protein